MNRNISRIYSIYNWKSKSCIYVSPFFLQVMFFFVLPKIFVWVLTYYLEAIAIWRLLREEIFVIRRQTNVQGIVLILPLSRGNEGRGFAHYLYCYRKTLPNGGKWSIKSHELQRQLTNIHVFEHSIICIKLISIFQVDGGSATLVKL